MRNRDFVVIGASAGGVEALKRLASCLPGDFPGTVLVVLHVGAYPSMLPSLLSAAGPLPAVHADDGQTLTPGRIYIAPPDYHLLVDGDIARLSRGPKEHHTRPAVDSLFRSAALAQGSRVVGVVLTGQLDDGTAGLQAIKACGGLAIVQDPRDAQSPSMPLSALEYVDVDHCLQIDAIAAMLIRLAGEPAPAVAPAPHELEREYVMTTTGQIAMDEIRKIGQLSNLSCPDCGGVLSRIIDSQPVRYRCHTGHGFTQRTLGNAMDDTIDEALWSAIRALREKAELLRGTAEASRDAGADDDADVLESRAGEHDSHAETLRALAEKAAGEREA